VPNYADFSLKYEYPWVDKNFIKSKYVPCDIKR